MLLSFKSVTKIKLILSTLLILGALLSFNTVKAVADETLITDLNKQIDEQRKKIDQMGDQIEKYNAEIKKVREQKSSLQSQVSILDNQIAKAGADIQSKESEIKATELEIDRVQLEIKKNELIILQNKTRLAVFIRQISISDRRSYLSMLLSNNSFSEFFDQVKYLEGIQSDLQNTLNRIKEVVNNLTSQKKELDDKRTKLSELLKKLEQQKDFLADQKGEKKYLITETKNSEKKFSTLMQNLKQEQISSNNAIASLEQKLREELKKRGATEKFNSLSTAALAWPTSKHTVLCYFHDPDYPYRNLFEHSGVDVPVGMGTEVRSAEAGYVARVSMGTKWYGNYIMIIHNNNLSTLYGHLSNINVKTDQYVAKGQLIGLSGNSGFSSGPHLHLEVRLNGIPVNPLNYLP